MPTLQDFSALYAEASGVKNTELQALSAEQKKKYEDEKWWYDPHTQKSNPDGIHPSDASSVSLLKGLKMLNKGFLSGKLDELIARYETMHTALFEQFVQESKVLHGELKAKIGDGKIGELFLENLGQKIEHSFPCSPDFYQLMGAAQYLGVAKAIGDDKLAERARNNLLQTFVFCEGQSLDYSNTHTTQIETHLEKAIAEIKEKDEVRLEPFYGKDARVMATIARGYGAAAEAAFAERVQASREGESKITR